MLILLWPVFALFAQATQDPGRRPELDPTCLTRESAGLAPIRRVSQSEFKDLLGASSLKDFLLSQGEPLILTGFRAPDWNPRDPACSDGSVFLGVYSTDFYSAFAASAPPHERRRLKAIAQDAHGMSLTQTLKMMARPMANAVYGSWLSSLRGKVWPGEKYSYPHRPDMNREVEYYIAKPMLAHDMPLDSFCPSKVDEWSVKALLGGNSGIPDGGANVFWGPNGSASYPLHVNDIPGQGPILKTVLTGSQHVAIFPPSEAHKLSPLNLADAIPTVQNHFQAQFQANALGPLEDLANFGEALEAKGWRDELRTGEALLFLGTYPHQFENSEEAFSLAYFV